VVSLFLQRGELPAVLSGWRQITLAGHRVYVRDPAQPDLTWSAGGYVFTVVADAPAPVVADVVNTLPHDTPSGLWGRMERGLKRLLSWLDLFG
jgi:sigma-E factor negative regulatory protein RseB